jgi:hypothetical protein
VDTDEQESAPQESAPAKKPQHRGLKYIGDGVAHYSGVPARDLTWAEARAYIGESYEARRHAVERDDAIYAWGAAEKDDE